MSKHGIKPEEVAAFGDGGNDREMLELAGHSYAVANASDEIKRLLVTLSNQMQEMACSMRLKTF